MYPYVIPFSGAAYAQDPRLAPYTQVAERHVAGTEIRWQQPAKILPTDAAVKEVVLSMERAFEEMLRALQDDVAHLPSRVRSLLWILASLPVMAERGIVIADENEVRAELAARLPRARGAAVAPVVAVA
jgi:hypothetical protein